MEDDFGVAMRAKTVALALQFRAELDVIEYLAVEGDGQPTIDVVHRLLAAGQVENAQPDVAQPDRTVERDTMFVGPAMTQWREHPRHVAAVELGFRQDVRCLQCRTQSWFPCLRCWGWGMQP